MNKNGLILIAALMVSTFSCFVGYQLKVKRKLDKLANTPVENWQWGDWPDNRTPKPITEEPAKEKEEKEQKENIQIVAKNYKDAIKQSKELNKTILIFYEADWCGVCKKMESETLSDKGVKEAMKEHILVIINVDYNRDLVRKYNIRSIPTYMIMDKTEKVLKSDSGFKDPSEFSKWMLISAVSKPIKTKIK